MSKPIKARLYAISPGCFRLVPEYPIFDSEPLEFFVILFSLKIFLSFWLKGKYWRRNR